ncbi:hypothetical protein WP1_297 [Pseudomonas phage WP1]
MPLAGQLATAAGALTSLPTVGDCRFHWPFEHLQNLFVLSVGAVAATDEPAASDPAQVHIADDVQASVTAAVYASLLITTSNGSSPSPARRSFRLLMPEFLALSKASSMPEMSRVGRASTFTFLLFAILSQTLNGAFRGGNLVIGQATPLIQRIAKAAGETETAVAPPFNDVRVILLEPGDPGLFCLKGRHAFLLALLSRLRPAPGTCFGAGPVLFVADAAAGKALVPIGGRSAIYSSPCALNAFFAVHPDRSEWILLAPMDASSRWRAFRTRFRWIQFRIPDRRNR